MPLQNCISLTYFMWTCLSIFCFESMYYFIESKEFRLLAMTGSVGGCSHTSICGISSKGSRIYFCCGSCSSQETPLISLIDLSSSSVSTPIKKWRPSSLKVVQLAYLYLPSDLKIYFNIPATAHLPDISVLTFYDNSLTCLWYVYAISRNQHQRTYLWVHFCGHLPLLRQYFFD